MTATKVQPRKPIAYSGAGSAIDFYKTQQSNPTPSDPQKKLGNWAVFDTKNPKHRVIMSLMRQAQWTKPHERHGEVADMDRLDSYLKNDKRCPVKKPLQKMSPEELEKLIVALNGIVKSVYK